MIIKRIAEKELVSILKFFPAVAILGPRQSGKTTLAKDILKEFKDNSNQRLDVSINKNRNVIIIVFEVINP